MIKKTGIIIILIFGFLLSMNLSAQDSDRWIGNKEYAKEQLEIALENKADTTKMKVKLFPKEENAINYAEIVLFELYGKDKIEFEKPYQIYLIDDYWIIFGTLPKGYIGGVFELVFDSWNGKVLRISHGK